MAALKMRGRPATILLLVVTLGVLGLIRWRGSGLDRPFEEDEWITVSTYTWAETQPSGERQELGHIADYRALPGPGARQLAFGAYCSAGRWSEPNNHIVHSLLVNLAQAVSRSERWARLPALLGGLAFAAGLFWLCGPVLRWWYVAPLVLAGAWFCPYVVQFSQTARGYTWSLALPVAWLIAVHALGRRPDSLAIATLCSTLAVLTFLNLVSLALDWLLPAYLALFIARPREGHAGSGRLGGDRTPGDGLERVDAARWRTVVLAQVLAVGAVGLMMLTAHLPAMVSSARSYGEPFASPGEFIHRLGSTLDYLFPGLTGKAIMACGVAGVALMSTSRRCPFLALLCVGVVAVTIGHLLLTMRFPYPRAAGYLLLPTSLGAAFLAESGLRRLPPGWPRVAGWLTVAVAVGWAGRSACPSAPDDDYGRFIARLGEEPARPSHQTALLRGKNVEATIEIYRPAGWDLPSVLTPGHAVQLCLMTRGGPEEAGTIDVLRRGESEPWTPSARSATLTEGPYRLARLAGATYGLRDGPAGRALLFWYPDPERLGLDSRRQLDLASASGLRYLVQTARHRVKMEVFGRLHAIIFIAESAKEYEDCALAVESGIRRFGGGSVALVAGGEGGP